MRIRFRMLGITLVTVALMAPVAATVAEGFFEDVPQSHTFADDIAWLSVADITRGCNPPENDRFCPGNHVTRGQMAAFITRAMGYTDGGKSDLFTDDDGSVFESDINRLGTAGVTLGCNPPDSDRYCPNDVVTREQMASFLVRAFGLGGGAVNAFVDDDGSVHESSIDRLYTAGITAGCNPPVNDRFCPRSPVTRGAMAAFLHRALGGAALGGHVFEDADLDGIFDDTEAPIQGVGVSLSGPAITADSQVSDALGGFASGPVEPGEYQIEIPTDRIPAGSLATTPTAYSVTVAGRSGRLDLDFGLRTPQGLEQLLVGAWRGTNTNPWTDPYEVEVEFRADGVYSAHAEAGYRAFYFGPDEDTPLKTYAIIAIRSGGIGSGEVAFVWVDFISPTIRMGEMRSISFTDENHVEIEIWDRGTYGPVLLDLNRTDG